jgi:hypothetical protein
MLCILHVRVNVLTHETNMWIRSGVSRNVWIVVGATRTTIVRSRYAAYAATAIHRIDSSFDR